MHLGTRQDLNITNGDQEMWNILFKKIIDIYPDIKAVYSFALVEERKSNQNFFERYPKNVFYYSRSEPFLPFQKIYKSDKTWRKYLPEIDALLLKIETGHVRIPTDLESTTDGLHTVLTVVQGSDFKVGDILVGSIQAKDFRGRNKQYGGDFFRARSICFIFIFSCFIHAFLVRKRCSVCFIVHWVWRLRTFHFNIYSENLSIKSFNNQVCCVDTNGKSLKNFIALQEGKCAFFVTWLS